MTKYILLLSCFLFSLAPHRVAGNSFLPTEPPLFNTTAGNLCNLPAPANFQVTSASSSSVSLAWDAVSGASSYYVAALDDVSQLVVDDAIVTATSATLYPPPGCKVDLQVYAICPDQSTSIYYNEIVNFTLIITELIVEYSAPCDDPEYDQGPITTGSVYVPWDFGYTYWFDVEELATEKISRYEVRMEYSGSNTEKLSVSRVLEQYYSNAWYSVESAATLGTSFYSSPPVYNFYTMQIARTSQSGTQPVYFIHYNFPVNCAGNSCLEIEFIQHHIGYAINFLTGSNCASEERSDGTEWVSNLPKDRLPAIAASPFSTSLRISNIQPEATTVHFSLFDLSGRVALDQTYPAASAHELATPDLPPGFYLLRIENGRAIQTLKVVKGTGVKE